jgi:hypothetical protein
MTGWRLHLRAVGRDPALLVWCLFLLLTPFYVVASGLPQPGDWLVLLLAPLALLSWNGKLGRDNSQAVKALLLFTVWVFVVNYAWALIAGRWSRSDFVLHPLFYLFNAAIFLSALIIARRDAERFLRITVDIVFVTVLVSLAGALAAPGEHRTQAFFNSPNQLGYYALLSACLFAVAQRPLDIGRLRSSVGIAACAYLAFVSASRASLAGILLLLVVLFVSDPKVIIAGALVAIGIVSVGGPVADKLEFNEKRAFEDRDPHESFAEERGYDRIWRFPRYLVLGAGEGDYERFARPGRHERELHSSFGSLLFSYGIIGVGLFLLFAARVVRGAGRRPLLLLAPALIYTVAHQGLRFTMFWVVLAAFVALKNLPESPRGRVRGKA